MRFITTSPRETKRFSAPKKTNLRKDYGMLKKILAAALACAVFGTTALVASAESSENPPAQSEENEPIIDYIYSEITERNIPSYGLYEEIIANQVVFYSNVQNGAVVEYPVTLDLPENVSVSVDKDGKKFNYTAGEPFEDVGRYSLTLTVEGKDLLGGKENEVFYGLFRFWIMEPSDESDPNGDSSDDSDFSDFDSSDDSSDESDFSSDISDDSSSSSESGSPNDPANPDDNPTETGTLLPKTDKAVGLSQYIVEKKIRAVTDRGTEFFCNIPAGMTTSNPVQLNLPDNAEYKMLINGEENANFEFNKSISARGEYKLLIIDGDSENPAEFEFTVIGKNVNKITQFSVPNGCRIDSAMFNKTAIRANGNTVDLGDEGTYSFDVYCGDYLMSESFTLDNTPPEFVVNGIDENGKTKGGKVFIELVSDDIDDYAVYRDKKPYKKTLELTEAGKYGIIVYDKAGNSSTAEFEIIYTMDTMAVVAVILAGAIVIAGGVFFIITRKKFSIR